MLGSFNLIRHGARNNKTFDSINKKFYYGSTNSHLTVLGVNQLKIVADYFKEKNLSNEKFFTSEKNRCVFSAQSFINEYFKDKNFLTEFVNTNNEEIEDRYNLNPLNFNQKYDIVKVLVMKSLFNYRTEKKSQEEIMNNKIFEFDNKKFLKCLEDFKNTFPEAVLKNEENINDISDSTDDFKLYKFSNKIASFLKTFLFHFPSYKKSLTNCNNLVEILTLEKYYSESDSNVTWLNHIKESLELLKSDNLFFFGHQENIRSLMSGFSNHANIRNHLKRGDFILEDFMVPFASVLTIELWENIGELQFRILLNGKNIKELELMKNNCDESNYCNSSKRFLFDINEDGFISYNDFTSILSKIN